MAGVPQLPVGQLRSVLGAHAGMGLHLHTRPGGAGAPLVADVPAEEVALMAITCLWCPLPIDLRDGRPLCRLHAVVIRRRPPRRRRSVRVITRRKRRSPMN